MKAMNAGYRRLMSEASDPATPTTRLQEILNVAMIEDDHDLLRALAGNPNMDLFRLMIVLSADYPKIVAHNPAIELSILDGSYFTFGVRERNRLICDGAPLTVLLTVRNMASQLREDDAHFTSDVRLLAILAEDDEVAIRVAVAGNSAIDEKTIEILLRKPRDPEVLAALGKNAGISNEMIESWARSEDPELKELAKWR